MPENQPPSDTLNAPAHVINDQVDTSLAITPNFMQRLAALGLQGEFRRAFWILVIFSAAINLFMLTVPLYMLQIYDRVLTSQSLETLAMLTIMAFGLLAVMTILDICRAQILTRLSARFDRQISRRLIAASLILSGESGEKRDASILLSMESLKRFISSPAFVMLFDAPWSPLYLLLLFLIHPVFGLISLIAAGLLVLFAYLSDYLTRGQQATTQAQLNKPRLLARSAIVNADAVIAMGMSERLSSHYDMQNLHGLIRQTREADISSTATSGSRFVRLLAQVCILGIGAWLVIEQQITAGIMIAASLIMSRALAPFERLLGSWQGFMLARQAFNQIAGFLSYEDKQKKNKIALSEGNNWKLKQVSVQFPGTDQPAIKDITLEITRGQAIGIIGPNSAGKSTLARVLAGAINPSSGSLIIDETDSRLISTTDYGKRIGYMPQDVQLLDASVYENITRFEGGNLEEAVKVAKVTGMHELILELHDGYDTQLGGMGIKLSGGKAQLLALTRAIYGTPSLVILDEPNAYLDAIGEKALIAAMNYCRDIKASIVIISHKPQIMGQLDYLYVMRDGQIELSGKPEDVHKKVLRNTGVTPLKHKNTDNK